MKTIFRILCFAAALVSTAGMSQDSYKSFRIGLGSGLVTPQKVLPGFLLYVEPSLRLRNYSIGIRVETVGRPNADVGILGSYTINGQYYFNKGPARFFGGIGFGAYTVNSGLLASCSCENQLKNTVMGFYPRIGIDWKHMVFALDYNIIQTATQRVEYDMPIMNATPSFYQASTSYVSLKFGWYIGIGRKKKPQ